MFETLLAHLHEADAVDLARPVADSASVRTVFGAEDGAESNRSAKSWDSTPHSHRCEKHPRCVHGDRRQRARRNPTAPAGGRHPARAWQTRVASPPPRTGPGRPRLRFRTAPRRARRAKRITPIIARRNTEHGSDLGTTRCLVERTRTWLHQFRRVRVQYEKRSDIHEAFLTIGCILICCNFIKGYC